jgi:4-hydroxythreonine-4-phosphate dehydrogenase
MTASPRAPEPAERHSQVLPLAVTMGDPAGIGPDITLAVWLQRVRNGLPPFAVFGDPGTLSERARGLGLDVPLAVVDSVDEASTTFADALPVVRPAAGPARGDTAVLDSIVQATASVAEGQCLALVTNPIAKRSLQSAGLHEPGHTELLAVLAQRHHSGRAFHPVMMLAAKELKVVPTTVHMPLSAVPGALTRALLLKTIRITAAALQEDFGIPRPRLAVAGLNPHAGEGGLLGREDIDTITPVVAELAAEGLAVTGPHSADALFHAEARRGYDAAIAMYHDQALIPLKTLAFDTGVNVTLGLPFVRTSPDHGTAFALAGTGKARPNSLLAALELAAEIGRRRARASQLARP